MPEGFCQVRDNCQPDPVGAFARLTLASVTSEHVAGRAVPRDVLPPFPAALKIKIRSQRRRPCHSMSFCISPHAP
jgi:hypothetical protein